MVKTEMIRLMTWRRQCDQLFPYGSSIVPVLITLLLIQTPTTLLIVDLFNRELTYWLVPVTIILLNIATLLALWKCVYTDPGIVPQNVNNYEWDEQLLQLPQINHTLQPQKLFLMQKGGLSVYQKYCIQCHIYRPLRSIHCRSCNHCVQRYDHHCPWLGVCIGKYNYHFFLLFLLMLDLMVLTIIITSAVVIVQFIKEDASVKEFIIEIIVGVIAIGFAIGLFRLLFYHFELTQKRMTTNQDLKETYQPIKGKVPFQRCQKKHPPLKDTAKWMNRSNQIEMSVRGRYTQDGALNKGKRYSTLVSDRQSVLNSLVEPVL